MANISPDDTSVACREVDVKAVFNQYYKRLVYFSYLIVNNKAQAEDIAQDSFIKYWNCSDTITSHPVAIKNFLYSSVKNASLNAIRHYKVAQQHLNTLDGAPIEEGVYNSIIRAEVLSEIHEAIALLPNSCQQIFKMSFLDEMKNHQIADTLGISVNTVKTQKQRALKVLKTQLSPELFIALAYLIFI